MRLRRIKSVLRRSKSRQSQCSVAEFSNKSRILKQQRCKIVVEKEHQGFYRPRNEVDQSVSEYSDGIETEKKTKKIKISNIEFTINNIQ